MHAKFEDNKGLIRSRKLKKGQHMIYKTLHGKLKIEQHEPHYKPVVGDSCSTNKVHIIVVFHMGDCLVVKRVDIL
jgi:hypothetical protein